MGPVSAPLGPGVRLCNARGVHEASTAELALTLTLASLRGVPGFVRAQQQERWEGGFHPALADRSVLIVGYGAIGSAIEEDRLTPFEVARRADEGDGGGHTRVVREHLPGQRGAAPPAPAMPLPGGEHSRYPAARPLTGSLAALTPYLAAAVCTLGILYNVLNGHSVDRVVLLTCGTVVLALVVRQGIMLLDNIALTQELAQKENHFRSLVQGSSDVIMIAAPNGVLRYVSGRCRGPRPPRRGTGRQRTGRADPPRGPGPRGARGPPVPRRQPGGGTHTRIECRFRSGDGGWLNVESTVNRHQGGLIFNSRDVTERVRLQAQLQHNAEHDPLTDLPNRALFTKRVQQALSGRRASDRGTALRGTAVLSSTSTASRPSTTRSGIRPGTSCSSRPPRSGGGPAGRHRLPAGRRRVRGPDRRGRHPGPLRRERHSWNSPTASG
ncbi:hypothetical protein SFUMM280S_02456 [Streptomyces fumanus]